MITADTSIIADDSKALLYGSREGQYRKFFRRFVLLVLIISLLPLLLVGWGINIHYTRFAHDRMTGNLTKEVDHHRKMIDLFLREYRSKLQLVARTHTKAHLCQPSILNQVFAMINMEYAALTDLGVIDHNGNHLAYIGPYDLMDKNYVQEFWFQQVMDKKIFISDMFLGFRREPHFIIAVTGTDQGQTWILRATINTDAFRALVENVQIGRTGEVFLINSEGIYQSNPRFVGNIMEKSSLTMAAVHEGIDMRVIRGDAEQQIVCSVWLREPRWLLVVQQDYAEAFDAVNHANRAVLVFLHISALSILLVAVLVARYMISMIRRRDLENDQLSEQLLQTGKLASIGELSAAVAHEINNPLAIMLTERQLLMDCQKQSSGLAPEFKAQLDDSLNQINIQIHRCKRITENLLRFSRRTTSMMEPLDLNAFIREVVELMEREAKTSGIIFATNLAADLPLIVSDVSQLQQVFLNLITNAIDAHDGKPQGRIDIATGPADDGRGIQLHIADTGSGIPKENLDKIFNPFFTTKPVGKGTGLGLSICHSIIIRLGGRISVHSRPGEGTRFDIFLPLQPPAETGAG